MIEGLKPYAEYKASWQAWLGNVPAHWELKPGHAAFASRKELNKGLKENTVLSLSYGRIKVKPTDKQHGLVPASYETYQIVNEGNLIIRGTDLQNDHTSLRIGLAKNRGIISSAYLCLETRENVLPDYGYQILNAFDITKAIYRYGSGLRQNLDHGEIKRLPIFLPPLDEQSAIVRFLDHANRKFDGFIRAKRKLIALLNEQKQAIIHRAVTRGLNPEVKLKPSGIAWLGDIPAHWEVRQLGRFITLQRGFDITKAQQSAGSIPVVSSGGISSYHEKSSSQGPGVIVGRKGSVGTVHFIEGPFWAHDTTLWVKDFGDNNAKFVFYVLSLLDLKRLDTGSANPTLNRNIVHPEIVGFPPPNEQALISRYLDNAVVEIKQAIARTEREIALMQEYRTRLTADIVTGKLDVRAAAAQLPAATPPGEPVNEDFADELDEPELEAESVAE